MSILTDVFRELLSMFVADARLTAAILGIVALAAALIAAGASPLYGGGLLFAGCVGVLLLSVRRDALRRKRNGGA